MLGLSMVAGPVHRRAALIGSSVASFTAFGSLLAMSRFGARSVKGALAVMVVAFLARIALVGLGTAVVARAGESIVAFVVAFFVPYFIFAAIEGWYLHSLNRGSGTPA
ncbi:MAG: hypothetical protein A2V77_22240 [Anaeromyxobacter sp. RBG_16_69_14]|nr:MAG: hypothetical protein A2V77_22240 [Anaeromyxobacter sp. RBG_16_69_14]